MIMNTLGSPAPKSVHDHGRPDAAAAGRHGVRGWKGSKGPTRRALRYGRTRTRRGAEGRRWPDGSPGAFRPAGGWRRLRPRHLMRMLLVRSLVREAARLRTMTRGLAGPGRSAGPEARTGIRLGGGRRRLAGRLGTGRSRAGPGSRGAEWCGRSGGPNGRGVSVRPRSAGRGGSAGPAHAWRPGPGRCGRDGLGQAGVVEAAAGELHRRARQQRQGGAGPQGQAQLGGVADERAQVGRDWPVTASVASG